MTRHCLEYSSTSSKKGVGILLSPFSCDSKHFNIRASSSSVDVASVLPFFELYQTHSSADYTSKAIFTSSSWCPVRNRNELVVILAISIYYSLTSVIFDR